jgi:hypothetical protein
MYFDTYVRSCWYNAKKNKENQSMIIETELIKIKRKEVIGSNNIVDIQGLINYSELSLHYTLRYMTGRDGTTLRITFN